MKFTSVEHPAKTDVAIVLATKKTDWNKIKIISKRDHPLIQSNLKSDIKNFTLHSGNQKVIVVITEDKKETYKTHEALRKSGNTVCGMLNRQKVRVATIVNESGFAGASFPFAEGIALSNYKFIKYKKEAEKESNSLRELKLTLKDSSKEEVKKLQALIDSVFWVRDLVNEPVNYLNAVQLANAFAEAGKAAGVAVEVLNKGKIESLKMGGLLSVNQGSIDPPTFSILEYKPANAVNKKPIVLVGKGVVYDTGGLSLKPTGNSMDYMKCDMAGAATIAGTILTAAKTNLPLHMIGLAPATDNRPGGNAFAPGDVIRMFDGSTVEMLNSDAEGRMILADALTYAKKYSPELVIDVATLTGAAHRALGDHAIAYMGTADAQKKNLLEESGAEVYERLVGFPLWEEYGDMLKSDIADVKNVGGALAGHITAGKFLERFTDYPWLHLDIAGMAYFQSAQNYKGKNATAVGVRLLFRYMEKISQSYSNTSINTQK